MSLNIDNEQIVEKMRSLPSKTRQDILIALEQDESLTAIHSELISGIFAGNKKETEEKSQGSITPEVYSDIVSSISSFDPFIQQDIAKLIIDDPAYGQEDYDFFKEATKKPESNSVDRKHKM